MLKASISLNLNSATEALIIICRKFLNKYSWERHRPNTFNSCSSAQLMLKQLTELNFKMILSFYPAIEISPLGFQNLCCIHLHSGTSQTFQVELFAVIVNARCFHYSRSLFAPSRKKPIEMEAAFCSWPAWNDFCFHLERRALYFN